MSAYQKYYIFAHVINHVEVLGGGNRLLQKEISEAVWIMNAVQRFHILAEVFA